MLYSVLWAQWKKNHRFGKSHLPLGKPISFLSTNLCRFLRCCFRLLRLWWSATAYIQWKVYPSYHCWKILAPTFHKGVVFIVSRLHQKCLFASRPTFNSIEQWCIIFILSFKYFLADCPSSSKTLWCIHISELFFSGKKVLISKRANCQTCLRFCRYG